MQKAHTPPECHHQISARILLEIQAGSPPSGLIKKYSNELWNSWKAHHEPQCTPHVEAFCNYVVFEIVKARIGEKLKILHEVLYRYHDHYKVTIHEDDIRKIKERLISHCKSWREQYGRFMFIPEARDPIPQYLGYTLSGP